MKNNKHVESFRQFNENVDIPDFVEEIYVVRDTDSDSSLQYIISGNLIIKTKSGKTYKVGVEDL